jgi:hypothetical protein
MFSENPPVILARHESGAPAYSQGSRKDNSCPNLFSLGQKAFLIPPKIGGTPGDVKTCL